MGILSNLFKVRKVKSYDTRLSAMDQRLHEGNDYRTNILSNSLSRYIQRNDTMFDFITMMQHVVADWVDSVTYLKVYKSYTVRKDDKKVK
jgi:hypothetical protein